MAKICRWTACPICEVVQPVLNSYMDDGGSEIVACRWCEAVQGGPYQYEVDMFALPANELQNNWVNEFITKVKETNE